MIYILDMDVFTLCELSDSPEYLRLHAHAVELNDDDRIVTTIITYEEQTPGWLAYAAKSRETQHQIKAYNRLKKNLVAYLGFDVLEFDVHAAIEFDKLRKMKLGIGASDLKIASIALLSNAVLLTRNLRDFRAVPTLRVEDWTKR